MLMPDMKALKSFCIHSNLMFLKPTKIPQSLCLLPRHFHPTAGRLREPGPVQSSLTESDSAQAENTEPVCQGWSVNPLVTRIVTQNQKSIKKSDEQVLEPKDIGHHQRSSSEGNKTSSRLSSFGTESNNLSDEGNGSSGFKNENLSDREKARMGLPRFNGDNEDAVNEKRYGAAKRVEAAEGLGSGLYAGSRKKGKSKTFYVCESCGYEDGQWWGICRECHQAGTMKQFTVTDKSTETGGKTNGIRVSETAVRSWLPIKDGEAHPIRLSEVNQRMDQSEWRIPLSGLFGNEVARVLGGGLVPGSLVLVGGDPGVGKSTLLLQIAALISEGQGQDEPAPVVYVSGEESVEQIVNRAHRLGIGEDGLFLYSSTDIEDILRKIQPLSPSALIVDSIQTVYIEGVIGSAGAISQVKECTSALLRFAKKTKIPILLIGHVTKTGEIAGPRVLEHIVDAVLYLEGEKQSTHRLLRPVKNRFGSTDELGVFEMSQLGLQTVSNPSEIFLSEQYDGSEVLAGVAVTVIMDGSRSFLIEIQALCASGSSALRTVNGIQTSRVEMIVTVLKKQAGLMLQDQGIFVNVISGVVLTETAGDLAIAAAICSSFLEHPIPNNVAFIGEIGLGGELRQVARIEKRVNTVAKLGYEECIVPESSVKFLSTQGFGGIKIVGCANLRQVINTVFKS